MVTKHDLSCFDEFTSRFIRAKVRQLLGRAGFTESDRPGLTQQFAADIIKRRKDFNPKTASWEAFVVVVCENCFATILEHRRAEMRSHKREDGSLNRPIRDGEGNRTEFGATISEAQPGRRTGRYPRPHEEAFDLVKDVASVLEQLPPRPREICERLKAGEPKSSIARDLGMSQGAFYGLLKRILARFEKASLRDYLA